MTSMITSFIQYVEKELLKKRPDKNLAENIITELSIFQHERLIHLIVTVFAGTCTIIFLLSFLYFETIAFLLLFLLTLSLFIPYIYHYYFLENSIQKLYNLYWKAKGK